MDQVEYIQIEIETTEEADAEVVKHPCTKCGKLFKFRKNLYEHIRNVHKQSHANMLQRHRRNSSVTCCICSKPESNRLQLVEHFINSHDLTINFVRKVFKDVNEFYEWKDEMERDTWSQYVLERGARKLADRSKKLRYYCSRSGDYEKDKVAKRGKRSTTLDENNVRQRRTKSQGTRKIGTLCPAAMDVRIFPNNRVEVSFWSTHVGHMLSLEHCQLSQMDKSFLMGKIAEGLTFDQILEEIRNSMPPEPEQCSRIHLVTRKDLHNIQKQMVATGIWKQDQNDPLSDSESMTKHSTFQEQMQEKLMQIIELCSNNIDDETCKKVIEHLDKVKDILSTTSLPKNEPNSEPFVVN